jgi:hypothetical protein
MYSSLSWIEWLDRLDRVLTGARKDLAMLSRAMSPRGMEAIERSKRQLAALINDLQLLDRSVLPTGADSLQKALDAALTRLGSLAEFNLDDAPVVRQRILAVIDSALRDSCYQAATLLGPAHRHCAPAAPRLSPGP